MQKQGCSLHSMNHVSLWCTEVTELQCQCKKSSAPNCTVVCCSDIKNVLPLDSHAVCDASQKRHTSLEFLFESVLSFSLTLTQPMFWVSSGGFCFDCALTHCVGGLNLSSDLLHLDASSDALSPVLRHSHLCVFHGSNCLQLVPAT